MEQPAFGIASCETRQAETGPPVTTRKSAPFRLTSIDAYRGWVLFSGGWCFLLLAGFYAATDLWQKKRWAFPLVVVGMNSIAAYCIVHLFGAFITRSLKTHLGQDLFKFAGDAYGPFFLGAAVLLVYWLILFWMYRRKVFLRI